MKPERKGFAAYRSPKILAVEKRQPILDARRAKGAESRKPGKKPQDRVPKIRDTTGGGEEARPEDSHRPKNSFLLDNLQSSWQFHWASGLPCSFDPERPFAGAEPVLIPREAAGLAVLPSDSRALLGQPPPLRPLRFLFAVRPRNDRYLPPSAFPD